MKRLIFLSVMAILFTGTVVKAEWRPVRHNMQEPVKLTVRGIDFFIFPNGEFDFNAHTRRHHYVRGDFAVRIERDRYGKIRRIGNVFLNYNHYGQIRRIGNVFISYNRRGLVNRIGNKHLQYYRYGYVVVYGVNNPVTYSSYYYGQAPGYYNSSANTYPSYLYDDEIYNDDVYDDSQDEYYFRKPKNRKRTPVKRRS
jgi:hypothetical protein